MPKAVFNYKRTLKILPLAASIILAALYAYSHGLKEEGGAAKISLPFSKKYDYNNILVTYVADGDTVKLEDGCWVRLIGIDCPEYHESEKLFRQARRGKKDIASIKKMGALAMAFTKEMLDNQKVRLEFDVEKRDKYNRLLAYLFLKDGAFVNAEIMSCGYAKILTIPPNVKYADLFAKLQKEAQEAKRGLWSGDY